MVNNWPAFLKDPQSILFCLVINGQIFVTIIASLSLIYSISENYWKNGKVPKLSDCKQTKTSERTEPINWSQRSSQYSHKKLALQCVYVDILVSVLAKIINFLWMNISTTNEPTLQKLVKSLQIFFKNIEYNWIRSSIGGRSWLTVLRLWKSQNRRI